MKRYLLLAVIWMFWATGLRGQNDTLVVGVYESPPFIIYGADGELEGVSAWLWEEAEKDLELPYRVVRYPAGHSLARILDDVEDGVIDLSINPLTITSERDERVDFTYPFFLGNIKVARIDTSWWRSFVNFIPEFFTSRVLLIIPILVGLVLLFGTLMWLIERKNKHFDRSLEGLLSSFWWSAVTMTTVGYGDKVPISNLGRFVAFLWMLCSVVIITIFTAGITSSLTVRQIEDADNSLQSFSRRPVGTVEASASQEFLERNFFRNLRTYEDLKSGLTGLANKEVEVFIYDEPWLVYQINNNPGFADMELLPVRFNPQFYAMPMRKDLDPSLKQRINSSLIQILESRDWQVVLEEYQLRSP